MRIREILATRRPVFSFEFFPPDGEKGTAQLFEAIAELRELHPDFVSVTCRNHSRHRTLELVTRIRTDTGIEPMAHYTCAGARRDELHDVLGGLRDAGVDNVLALRGDLTLRDGTPVPIVEDGLCHGSELAGMIRDAGYGFCIGAACYPEGHPESADVDEDMRHTVAKVENGAEFLISQLFFENRHFFAFLARARAAGITVPIIPGIMPITNAGQVPPPGGTFFGSVIPEALRAALERRRDDREAVVQLGVAWATLQCTELLAAGVPGIHFYTLNRVPATRAILSALQAARPWERAG